MFPRVAESSETHDVLIDWLLFCSNVSRRDHRSRGLTVLHKDTLLHLADYS